MYICKGCGQENGLGSVHCIKCGTMLDINNIQENEVKQDTTGSCYTSHNRTSVILKSIIGLSVYFVIFLSIFLLWPTLFVKDSNYNSNTAAVKRIKSTTYSSRKDVQVTEQELAFTIMSTLRGYFAEGASWSSSVAREVSVKIVSPQRIKVTFKRKMLNGNLPFDVTYLLNLPAKKEKFGKVELISSSIGLVPFPASLMSSFNDEIVTNIKRTWLFGFISRIKYAYTKNGKITIKLRRNGY